MRTFFRPVLAAVLATALTTPVTPVIAVPRRTPPRFCGSNSPIRNHC